MPNVSGLGMQGQANFTFIGFPYDEKSSFRRGCALAPAKIRSQFFGRVVRELTPYQIRLQETARIADAGDVVPECSDLKTLKKLENKWLRWSEAVDFRLWPAVTTAPQSEPCGE